MTFDLNTPRAPSGLEQIEDAMRRDTAAPSSWGLAFLCSVSASCACKEIPADPLVDPGRSWEILADPVGALVFIRRVKQNICKHRSNKGVPKVFRTHRARKVYICRFIRLGRVLLEASRRKIDQ